MNIYPEAHFIGTPEMGMSISSAAVAADLLGRVGAVPRQVVPLLAVVTRLVAVAAKVATPVRLLQSVAVDVVQPPQLAVRGQQPLKLVEIARRLETVVIVDHTFGPFLARVVPPLGHDGNSGQYLVNALDIPPADVQLHARIGDNFAIFNYVHIGIGI